MIDPHPILYCGRNFSSEDLALMRQAARDCAGLGVTEIARTICDWLEWAATRAQSAVHRQQWTFPHSAFRSRQRACFHDSGALGATASSRLAPALRIYTAAIGNLS